MNSQSQSPLAALTKQIGGENALNCLIMRFSEGVLQSLDLEVAFKGMDAGALAEHMSNLIKMVFGYPSKSNMVNSNIRRQIVLRNYALFELGLSRAQLSLLQLHFEATMLDCVIEGEVFELCKDRFADLCIMFEAEKRALQQSSDSMLNDPAMIMLVRASRGVVPKAA